VKENGAAPASFGTVGGVGETFFTDFLFPFEGISLLLLIAVIGAVVLARAVHDAELSEEILDAVAASIEAAAV